MTPRIIARVAHTIVVTKNGTWVQLWNFERKKPAVPAKASCASEVCPTYPVITTYDSAINPKTSDIVMPKRHSPCVRIIRTAITAKVIAPPVGLRLGSLTSGRRMTCSEPRAGRRLP